MVKAAEKKAGKVQPVRLYVKGAICSFKRSGTATQYENQNIMKIQGVQDRASTAFYLGKKVAYVYKAQTEKKGSKSNLRLCMFSVVLFFSHAPREHGFAAAFFVSQMKSKTFVFPAWCLCAGCRQPTTKEQGNNAAATQAKLAIL